MEEARRAYRKEKYAEIAAKVTALEKEAKQKRDGEVSKNAENTSKAAEDVSEGEELLKFVGTENCINGEETEETSSESDEKPLPVT